MRIVVFIFLCTCFAGAVFLSGLLRRNYLTTAALLGTVVGNVFLLLVGRFLIVALVFFLIAQVLYATRVAYNRHDKRVPSLGGVGDIEIRRNYIRVLVVQFSVRAALIFTAVLIVVSNFGAHGVFILASIVAVNILCNVVFALATSRHSILFAVGLSLLLLGSIMIALLESPGYIDGININHNLVFTLMWIFYIPANILIGISVAEKPLRPRVTAAPIELPEAEEGLAG